jgi:hypothetical protein
MQTPISRARHDLRGRFNALKLCIGALDICNTPADVAEFIEMIDRCADQVADAAEEMERVFDAHGGWTTEAVLS